MQDRALQTGTRKGRDFWCGTQYVEECDDSAGGDGETGNGKWGCRRVEMKGVPAWRGVEPYEEVRGLSVVAGAGRRQRQEEGKAEQSRETGSKGWGRGCC